MWNGGYFWTLSLCVYKKLLVGFKCWFIFFSVEWESRWKYTDGWKIGEIVRCLFLWCYDKKARSCRALNLILIHFWLVIILTWLIIKAEPSKQEFRFNLLELQNIFNHSLSAKDWLIYKCNMEQKTDLGLGWAIISITNLNPIKFSQSFPAAVSRTRL